jgi:hypothetical protein
MAVSLGSVLHWHGRGAVDVCEARQASGAVGKSDDDGAASRLAKTTLQFYLLSNTDRQCAVGASSKMPAVFVKEHNMLDLSKLSETITSFFGHTGVADLLQQSPVGELLQNAGINPAMLEGLNANQVMQTLADHGIDPTQLAPEQLATLLQSLGIQLPGR